MNEITTFSALELTLAQQQQYFNQHLYPTYQERVEQLTALRKLLLANQPALINAISTDFGHRSADECKIGDILTTVSSVDYTLKHLKRWMKTKRKQVGVLFQPASAKVMYQPKGVVAIVAPWNYPLLLSIGPLISAIAAGNVAMIKMSEYSPNLCTLLATLLAEIFEPAQVAVVGGDASLAAKFTALPVDHLFFTGSTSVGKLVMKSAADNLVPVTLELGGKSPAIIDASMDIATAVSRLMFGKVLNAGQTCVAPDYIFCPRAKVDELVAELSACFSKMYPHVADNNDYTSIIADHHYQRLQGLLEDAKAKGGQLLSCSLTPEADAELAKARKLPLTLILNPQESMQVMQDEIFGPILPIMLYDTIEEVVNYINAKPRPLALYLCSYNKALQQQLLLNTHSGGVCINDASLQVAVDDLPFGGIGASGMGQYHGEEGFKTLSHQKSVLTRGRINFTPLLFPPFNTAIHRLVYKWFIR